MKVHIKLLRSLYERMREDLLSPHKFAEERVGFLTAKLGNQSGDKPLILLTDYFAVLDEYYIDDPKSGARINNQAIRAAMQKILDSEQGIFHVHLHPHRGKPRFSGMDRKENPRLIPSFQAVGPTYPHGLFLLSFDSCHGAVWCPGKITPTEETKVSIIGYPTILM